MPIYEYEHQGEPCKLGKIFEVEQSFQDDALTQCPECAEAVRRLISRVSINITKTNSELKDMGFTKLVKRDNGVYENVTKRGDESRYVERDKPETLPDLSKTIRD